MKKSRGIARRTRSREIFGFMMFDFANSSYTTVIITAVFNVYFVQVVVNQANRGELLWSITLSISYAIVVVLGPIFGALADYSGTKKRFLFFTYLLCVVFTGLLFFIKPGYIVPAIVFIVLSNVGYAASENFVSSFLPDIASGYDMARISGYAWAFGYVGGLLSLGICLVIITFYHPAGAETSFLPIRLSNLVTALFFGVAAIPTFMWVKERKARMKIPAGENIFSVSFKRLAVTLKNIREFKELVKFLISFLFFYSGIAVVISFAAVYAQKELGFDTGMTVLLVIVVNITASVGAFIFGFIAGKIGAKKTILVTLIIWIVTVSIAYVVRSKQWFWLVANLAGIAMGASQSSARALVGLFSPPSKSAEFFGFWGFAGKLSAILGLLSFGIMSYLFKSNRIAITSTIVYFIIGFIILIFVNEEKGRSAAVNYVDNM
ncbi:MAG TPA: MFS transporter [Spirochaetes bacterium]|nr:MFS transporter [Spirochaetota bacterium]